MRSSGRAKRRSSRGGLVGRFAALVPGFNERALDLEDLAAICDRVGIEVVEVPLRRYHGCAVYVDGLPFLYLNSLLAPPEKIIAGWHEFAHLVDHPPDLRVFTSTGGLWNLGKADRQAQAVGCLALMPDAEVWGLNLPEIMERYGVPRQVAEFRLDLMFSS